MTPQRLFVVGHGRRPANGSNVGEMLQESIWQVAGKIGGKDRSITSSANLNMATVIDWGVTKLVAVTDEAVRLPHSRLGTTSSE